MYIIVKDKNDMKKCLIKTFYYFSQYKNIYLLDTTNFIYVNISNYYYYRNVYVKMVFYDLYDEYFLYDELYIFLFFIFFL